MNKEQAISRLELVKPPPSRSTSSSRRVKATLPRIESTHGLRRFWYRRCHVADACRGCFCEKPSAPPGKGALDAHEHIGQARRTELLHDGEHFPLRYTLPNMVRFPHQEWIPVQLSDG